MLRDVYWRQYPIDLLSDDKMTYIESFMPEEYKYAPYMFYITALKIDDYCGWTLSHLLRAPDFAWLAERAADWQQPWAGYTMTRYGRKAAREGRKAAYLRFRRTG